MLHTSHTSHTAQDTFQPITELIRMTRRLHGTAVSHKKVNQVAGLANPLVAPSIL